MLPVSKSWESMAKNPRSSASLKLARSVLAAALALLGLFPANADEPGPVADIFARASINSDRGGVVRFGATAHRIGGRDVRLRFAMERSRDDTRFNFAYRSQGDPDRNPRLSLSAFVIQSQAGSVYGFDSMSARIEPRLNWRMGEHSTFTSYVSVSRGEISNVSAMTSQIIRNDAGSRIQTAIGAIYNWRQRGEAGGRPAFGLNLRGELGRSDRGHEYASATARSSVAWSPSGEDGFILRAQVKAGAVRSLQGASHIGDRFLLGQSSLRGFELGGFGPRDLSVTDVPALGGNNYLVARFDAQFPTAFGSGSWIQPGLFVDIGSLWGLDDTAGGVAGANPVNDTAQLNGSVGVSVRIETGIGNLNVSVASPFASQVQDRLQQVQFSLNHAF